MTDQLHNQYSLLVSFLSFSFLPSWNYKYIYSYKPPFSLSLFFKGYKKIYIDGERNNNFFSPAFPFKKKSLSFLVNTKRGQTLSYVDH